MANTFISLPVDDVAITTPVTVNIDKLKIWDGSDILQVNNDGSINTRDATAKTIEYGEIFALSASGTYTTILTKVMTTSTMLYSFEASGNNLAEYIVLVNGLTIDKKWSYWSSFSVDGNFNKMLVSGDVVQVQVRHSRPTPGDFSAKLLFGV